MLLGLTIAWVWVAERPVDDAIFQIDPQAPRVESPRMNVPIVALLRTEYRRWKGHATSRLRRGRAASWRPQVEGLEDRALLASITEYPLPEPPSHGSFPNQIVAGPDGNLWVTVYNGGIDKVTPSGKFTEYQIPDGGSLFAITNGPDGALWFTAGGVIGRITTSGQISEYPLSHIVGGNDLYGIVTGPDGALWFTDFDGAAICRITTTGQVTQYVLPEVPTIAPNQIAVGSDGALWFTSSRGIGRITTSGKVTTYQPKLSSPPQGIVSGPDGNLWVTEGDDQHIAMITTTGLSTEFSTQTPSNSVGNASLGITVGTDGNMYFAEWFGGNKAGSGSIGRISAAGAVQHSPTGITYAAPRFLTTRPDGNIWFTDPATNAIGVMSAIASPTPTPTPSPTPTPTPSPSPTPTPTPTPAPSPTSTFTGPTTPPPAPPPRPASRLHPSSPGSRPLSTRTFLSVDPLSTALGRPVILTARVTDLGRPQFNPTGTVAFMAGGTRLGTANLQDGMATLTTAVLPAGRDRLRVVYLGTNDFRRSRSAILMERVGARPPIAARRSLAAHRRHDFPGQVLPRSPGAQSLFRKGS